MPPRKGSQKVKTGCRTCKARKVKCDERKPSCDRCTATGRRCGGYEPVTVEQGLSWYRPRQLTAHDEREGRAFHFFSRVVGPVLSGSMDSYFWTHLVMQFSHFEPAVRHAVIAISALYEDFQRGARVMRRQCGNVFAINNYNAAIQRIKSTQDEQLILLVCILFICVEYLQGEAVAAVRHCQHGMIILNRARSSSWAREHLLPIFLRLGFLPFFGGSKLIAGPGLLGLDTPGIMRFDNISQAQISLDKLMAQAQALRQTGDELQRDDLEASLQQWRACAIDLDDAFPSLPVPGKLALIYMWMKYEMTTICAHMALESDETKFDRHFDGFQAMVDWGSQASYLKNSLPPEIPRPSFTFELGFLPLVFFVVIRCRRLDIRLEALSLLATLCVAKEGLFDVGTLYRVGQRVIEIEHDISLSCGGITDKVAADTPLPPRERRVLDALVDHELEVLTNMDGTTVYRRKVTFPMRDAAGRIFALEEYVTDQKSFQGLRIPNMRCAHPI